MFIKVCPDTGFNDQNVAHWNFELVAPPDPPATQAAGPAARGAAGRSDVSRAEASRLEASRSAAEREEEDKDKRGARDVEPTPQEEVPVPQPVPTLTLYFVGGGELKLEGSDATKVQNYFGVPSSYMTVL